MTEKSQVLIGVCGSIAAYKSVAVVREVQRLGHPVQVIMTPSALDFVGKSTLEGLTRRPVYSQMTEVPDELHVTLAKSAHRFIVVAATADFLARLATGRASDLLSATAMCYDGPLFVAPAMHPNMWKNAAVVRNVDQLRRDGVRLLGPTQGVVASGDVGMGRMLEAAEIVDAVFGPQDLSGKRLIVTAGPTVEDLDPVRFISNRSTGRMGYAVAERAVARGATVELVTGPVHLTPPAGVRLHPIRSALELLASVRALCATPADAVIMTAAVGDYRVREVSPSKLKRANGLSLDLVENPDIIATLAQERRGKQPTLVAFALETGDDAAIIEYANQKLAKKSVDLVVANRADEALGGTTNRVHFVHHGGHTSHPSEDKLAVADRILDFLVGHWSVSH